MSKGTLIFLNMLLKQLFSNFKPILEDFNRPLIDPGVLKISNGDFNLNIGVIAILLGILTLHKILKRLEHFEMTKIPILNLNFGLN